MPKAVVIDGTRKRKKRQEVRVIRRYKNPTTTESVKLDEQSIRFGFGRNEFEILSLPAVARRLHRTETRVIQLVEEKKLKGYKLGRVWIVTDSDLDKYLEARRRELHSRYRGYLEEEFLSEN